MTGADRDADALAPWAARGANSRGRSHREAAPRYRGEFQRDRDRIVHSSAFRRLVYKTQVFINHEGDLYRTRLTHSLEVAQIGRSVACALRLNESLTEAICLAHDLGHTPFGHAGQDALNECMKDYGGFEHNLQSLRVVDVLEDKYAEFDGLNLTFETREGILKHCALRNARELGAVGQRFIERSQPGLEAQLANLADEIAYNNHDVDDGLRAGLIDIDALRELQLFRDPFDDVRRRYPDIGGRRLIHEVVRRMIDRVVSDLIETSAARIAAAAPEDIDAVRAADSQLIGFSAEVQAQHRELKSFLRDNLYYHYRVQRVTSKAKNVLRDLFGVLFENPRLLPPEHSGTAAAYEDAHGEAGRALAVADYVAGMTDRFALKEHDRLFDPRAPG